MENERLNIDGFDIRCYTTNTLVIGSGAASLNAAVSLHSMGQPDLIIATSQWGGGTSNNAGSDKQTYYRLSISGDKPDSVIDMAQDLFNGKCMHGDIALCESQGSVQAFMNLVRLGVSFPQDKYGSWAGYKTDHDPRSRATSAGPYTSKRMFEALAEEVKRRKITRLDHHHVVALLTDRKKSRVIGALAINTKEKKTAKAFVLFNSENIVLGTGGPGGIYETSVYPVSQSGSVGMAFRAGATGQNLTESQFGIASTKFRWNLSGSYQQVIPRYISTNAKGNERREFLNDYFPDITSLTKAIFLKGYQWPFDPGKVAGYGSSLIDILVHREITVKRRKVYLDYSGNPRHDNKGKFSLNKLDPEVYGYLQNSDALKRNPIDRLFALNMPAYALYKEQGIDLAKEPLQIAVCAQHNNGGLKADIWWESNLRHLFPVGEVNGSHGVYRPGGSALNSGQVGSYRAARFISRNYRNPARSIMKFLSDSEKQVREELALAKKWLHRGYSPDSRKYLREIRKRMSESGGIIRDENKTKEASGKAAEMFRNLHAKIGADSVKELAESFLLTDHCLTHYIYLEAIRTYLEGGGKSRGSYLVTANINTGKSAESHTMDPELCRFDRDIEKDIIEMSFRNGKITRSLTKVRQIPKQDLWFEKIWKEFLEDNSIRY
jgi:succinate dehydrogenase/fumarate reductase flavoprotein subunit